MAERLSASAGWELADAIRNLQRPQRESASGTAVFQRRDPDGTCWVTLPGSDAETPVNGEAVASASPGDEVRYEIRDGMLSITGNTTDPAVGQTVVSGMVERARETVEQSVSEVGGIAGAAQRVANAINQHFWADTNGIHVTESTREDWADSQTGANVLINSLGQLFRDGLTNLLTMTTESGARALTIWDGAGNATANIRAVFGDSIRIGKTSGDHVTIDATNGITLLKAGLKRLRTTANGVDVYGSDGSTSVASFGSTARVGSASSNNVLINTNGLTVRSGSTVWSRVMQGSKTWLDHVRKVTKTATVTGIDILGGFTSGGASLFASPQTDGVNAHLLAGNPSSTNGAGIDIASVRRWSSDASKYDSAAVEAVVNAGGSSPYARLLASSGNREDVGVMVDGSSDRPITLTGDNLYVKSSNNGDGVVTTTRAFPCRGMEGQNTTVPAGGYKDISVSFNHYYTSAPTVVVGLYSGSTSSDIGQCSVAVQSVTTSGFTARIFNASGTDRAPGFYWIAVG